MKPAWLGMTLPEFSTPINGRLVSVCITPLSACIYIAIPAISFIASSSKWKHGLSWAFWLMALFLPIWYFEWLNLKWGGHHGISCHPSSLHFITELIPLHCASPLFALRRVPALQACAWCPLQRYGAHCKLVVPLQTCGHRLVPIATKMWYPLQTCDHNCVPIANWWCPLQRCGQNLVPIASGPLSSRSLTDLAWGRIGTWWDTFGLVLPPIA